MAGVALAAGMSAKRCGAKRSSRVVCAAGSEGKKRCLVMGGTRFIGCYLVAKLRRDSFFTLPPFTFFRKASSQKTHETTCAMVAREQGHDVVVCNRGKTNGGQPDRLPGAPWPTVWLVLACALDGLDFAKRSSFSLI